MKPRMASKWCFMNFTKKLSTECGVVRDEDTKGCFTCDDEDHGGVQGEDGIVHQRVVDR